MMALFQTRDSPGGMSSFAVAAKVLSSSGTSNAR
jgi:hypothetical protein